MLVKLKCADWVTLPSVKLSLFLKKKEDKLGVYVGLSFVIVSLFIERLENKVRFTGLSALKSVLLQGHLR